MNAFSMLGDVFLWPVLTFIGIVIILAVVSFYIKDMTENGAPSSKKIYTYRRKKFFMTKAENLFYKDLLRSVGGEYCIFAQVHLPTIIDEKVRGQNWKSSRAHIDRKSVDFVLCEKEYLSPKLAIELDDWSHAQTDRQERDREVERILEEAGLPLLRVTDSKDLSAKIQAKLGAS